MRTRLLLLSAILAGSLLAACGDDGGSPTIDARPVDAPMCTPVDDSNECTTDECVNDVPVNTPRTGEACAGGGTCSATGACVVPTCTDTIMNGDETGVDCGGSCAPMFTCDTGEGCAIGGDCTSGVCGTAMTCLAPACGDGVVQAGEMCDDGNMTNGDGCDDGAGGTCRPTGCGNGVVTGTEVCDDGNDVNGDGCDNNCTATACGNGVTAGAETCDDGNTAAADGCDAACATETGFTCTTVVPSVCTAICGDGLILGAETCDQGAGNVTPGDGCDASCTTESGWTCTGEPSVCATVCGDGVAAGMEVCDDGNTLSLDGCDATCGAVDTAATGELEPNEDGSTSIGPTGIAGNDFDTGGVAVANATAQGVILVSAGDTLRIGSLTPAGDEDVWAVRNDTPDYVTVRYDTWNRAAGFGLGVACASTIDTGLNVRNAAGAVLQSSDDRNGATDRCSGLARALAPGETVYAHIVEYSDNGVIAGYALQLVFTPIPCGDGVLGGAACDDGNMNNGDGCSANCTIEPNYVCSGAPSVCTPVVCGDGLTQGAETCDDGNATPGDGCGATCVIEPNYVCAGAPSVCTPVVCGDGVANGAETCDDGNATPGDGCGATCAIEAGFYCGGAPSLCRAQPTSITLACVDMTGATTLSATGDDTVAGTTALPFPVTTYGVVKTHFAASTNGFVALLTSAGAARPPSAAFNATSLPSTSTPNGMVAPFWDDLVMTTPGMQTQLTGTAGSQVFTIQWLGRTFNITNTIAFQVQFHENGPIEFHYCSGDPGTDPTGPARISGNSATIGIENGGGTIGFPISINTAGAITWGTTAYRFANP